VIGASSRRVHDVLVATVLLMTSFATLVHELTLPFAFVGNLFFNTQHDFLPHDGLQDKRFVGRDRLPVLNLASVDGTSALTER
jgi:hypothetical protein